jgi:hypothetical protein
MSAKNALITFRSLGVTGVQEGFTLSSRTNPFTGLGSSFNLNIGGQRFPQKPIQTNRAGDITEYFSELLKSFHALGAVDFATSLPRACYTSSETILVTNAPSTRGFVIGLNLDTLVRQTDLLMSGLDMSKVTSYMEANITTPIPALNQQTIDTFIHHDMYLVVDVAGNLVSKF